MAITPAQLDFSPAVALFDANISVGTGRLELGRTAERQALLDELDRHGVGRAVVYHRHADEVSPIHGNNLLQHWLHPDQRLLPLWSALPTEESLTQITELNQAGLVRAVRLSPAAGLPFVAWIYHDLLSWLATHSVPLWIALPDLDPAALVATLRNYPQLRVVVTEVHYSHALLIERMLAALPGLHLELSRFEPLDGVRRLIARFGVERLLYGSAYPRYALGPIAYYLHHCNLDSAQLTQICSGNLERLYGGVGS